MKKMISIALILVLLVSSACIIFTAADTSENKGVTYMVGDADGDNIITVLDATKIQRILAGYDKEDDADGMVTLRGALGDDSLNIMHATKIQRYLADFDVDVPIGTVVNPTAPTEQTTEPQTNPPTQKPTRDLDELPFVPVH